jgi:hypothetical protein
VLFAFDPQRRAILLIGGDKSGNWSRWYQATIPVADDRFAEHLSALTRQRSQPTDASPARRKGKGK